MKMVRLGDIIKLEYGKSLPHTDRNAGGKYPAYGANGIKTRTDKYFYDKPSIIVGRKGSAGELTLTSGKFWPLDVTYFVTHDESVTDLIYIYRLLTTLNLPAFAKGVKPGINRNEIYAITVALPTLGEQQRVVKQLGAAFEKIDRAIKLTEENVQHTLKLKDSILLNKLSGLTPRQELLNVFDFKNGRAFKKSEWKNKGVPIIRIQNLNDTTAPHNYFQGVYDKSIEVNNGDLLFSWSGTVGTSFGPHIWSRGRGVLNQHIFKLSAKKEIDITFAYYALRVITSEIEEHTHGAGGLVHITKKKLEKFTIPNVPLDSQKQIATYLTEATERAERIYAMQSKKIRALKRLKRTLLMQAFPENDVK